MKEHPILFSAPMVRALLEGRKFVTRRLSKQWLKVKAGDRLWVRESWAIHDGYVLYRADLDDWSHIDGLRWSPSIHMHRTSSRILLECTEDARLERLQDITESEIEAEGTQIPVRRVQDPPVEGFLRITGKNAPVKYMPSEAQRLEMSIEERTSVWLRAHFASLWDDLHTTRGERWEDNPEVVRVGRFRRIG